MTKFVGYILDNYFEGSFLLSTWNHFLTVVNRTNNHLEGYNKKLYCFFNKIPTKKERQFLNNITFLVLKICTNGTNCFWMAEYCEFFMRQSVTDVRHDILYFIPFSGEFRSSLIETLIHQMPFECCNQCMFPTFN